jgi:hypothetical protein
MTKRFLYSSLVALLLGTGVTTAAHAQSTRQPSSGVGNQLNYPPGSRVYPSGRISTPNGIIAPSVAVPRGDGSTTYYYPNGTRIDVPNRGGNPLGTYLRPNTPNGGLRDSTRPNLYRSTTPQTNTPLNRPKIQIIEPIR